MSLLGRRTPRLPSSVSSALDLGRTEKVLAWATDDNTHAHVVATNLHVAAVTPDGSLLLKRPWHLVDAGSWNPDTWTLSVTWVDAKRPAQWTFKDQENRFPEAFRERVQTTVVLSEPLGLKGPHRTGRVVLRKNLATQQLQLQTVLGRGTPADDPEVKDAVARVGAFLKEQAGL